MYSRYNEGKPVVAEKIYYNFEKPNFLAQFFSKTFSFDVLDDIFNKYNNAVHRTIKMKSIHVKSDSYVEYNFDSN